MKPKIIERENGHEWCSSVLNFIPYVWCLKCLVIRRADKKNGPCKGKAKLSLRDQRLDKPEQTA